MSNDDPEPVDFYVGQMVRAERKLAGMSQGKLAEQIGVSFQQVQKYENATNRISASMLVAISRALKCRPIDLLPPDADGESAFGDIVVELAGAQYGLEIFQAVLRMSNRDRKTMAALARSLAGDGA